MRHKRPTRSQERPPETGSDEPEVLDDRESPERSEKSKPDLREVDLQRPPDRRLDSSISLETESRQEYFRFLQGHSRYDHEIRVKFRGIHHARSNSEEIILGIIRTLL